MPCFVVCRTWLAVDDVGFWNDMDGVMRILPIYICRKETVINYFLNFIL